MSDEVRAPGGPGIVLVGIGPTDDGFEAIVDRYRARGYATLTPPLAEISDVERSLEVIRTAMHELKAGPSTNGNVAVVGYGLGGCLAFLAVTRLGADAAVAFDGIGIGRYLREAPKAKKPLSLHFADEDELVPFEEVRAIKGALEGFGAALIYRYPQVRRGFARSGSHSYDPEAAAQAEARVFAFLQRLH